MLLPSLSSPLPCSADTKKPQPKVGLRLVYRKKRSDSGNCCLITTLHFFPVDHVEERADVIGALVLEFQVVRVLPNVQPQHRRVTVHERAVLVKSVLNHQLLLGSDTQPGPAATEAAQTCFGEGILESLEATQLTFDSLGHLALRLATAIG